MQWAVTYWIGISEMGYTPNISEGVVCVTLWWIVVENSSGILEYDGRNRF